MADDITNPSFDNDKGARALAVEIDFEACARMLIAEGCDEAQVNTVLTYLMDIACAFVEFGYSVHPVQQDCGQDHRHSAQGTQSSPADVQYSLTQLIKKEICAPTDAQEREVA